MSYLFAFSYCSWGYQGKNTKVVCHFLLQWTTFFQTSPTWPIRLGWPRMAWLSFIELDKAVVHVIRLDSCLWLWFQSVCPLMPSLSSYHLTLLATYLGRGVAPPGCCPCPRTLGSSSWLCLCAITAAHACALSQPPTHENDRMIYVCFQGKPFNIMAIQVYALTSNWRSWSWMVLWRPIRPSRTNTQKRCPFHYRGLEYKSRKSRNTWSSRKIWPWNTEWNRAKVNRVLPRECTGHSKHPLPTTQEKTLHMDITRWSTLKSDWLYSLQPKMEKLYTVSKNKTGSWQWLRSWTPYCQIQTEMEESGENHYTIQVLPKSNPLWLYSKN